jgi:hypothetical protein
MVKSVLYLIPIANNRYICYDCIGIDKPPCTVSGCKRYKLVYLLEVIKLCTMFLRHPVHSFFSAPPPSDAQMLRCSYTQIPATLPHNLHQLAPIQPRILSRLTVSYCQIIATIYAPASVRRYIRMISGMIVHTLSDATALLPLPSSFYSCITLCQSVKVSSLSD